jgi:MFS family permease
MFDWSGLYFSDVIGVKGPLVTVGYTAFMITMATGRFLGDRVINKLGKKKALQINGLLIFTGLLGAVLLPYVIPSTIAFMLVGLGVSVVLPTVYSIAGKHATIPAGEALTVVTTIGFLGFLGGPPIIGYVSEIWGLQVSFAAVAVAGLIIAFLVSQMRAFDE